MKIQNYFSFAYFDALVAYNFKMADEKTSAKYFKI